MSYTKEKVKEPLILEPEDWSKAEWKTICKMFVGEKKANQCERIVISNYTFESFINKVQKVKQK